MSNFLQFVIAVSPWFFGLGIKFENRRTNRCGKPWKPRLWRKCAEAMIPLGIILAIVLHNLGSPELPVLVSLLAGIAGWYCGIPTVYAPLGHGERALTQGQEDEYVNW